MTPETSPVKDRPECPECGKQMSVTGTKNRGDRKPIRVFQCMAVDCLNRRRYNRHGQEMW